MAEATSQLLAVFTLEDGQVVWTNKSSQNRLLVGQIIRCENVSDKILDEQVV